MKSILILLVTVTGTFAQAGSVEESRAAMQQRLALVQNNVEYVPLTPLSDATRASSLGNVNIPIERYANCKRRFNAEPANQWIRVAVLAEENQNCPSGSGNYLASCAGRPEGNCAAIYPGLGITFKTDISELMTQYFGNFGDRFWQTRPWTAETIGLVVQPDGMIQETINWTTRSYAISVQIYQTTLFKPAQ